MKRIINLLVIVIFIAFAFQSCKKSEFDINQNPNQATDSTISYNVILPAAQAATARVITRQWGWLQNYLGYWARSGTYAPNVDEETYNLTTTFQVGIWNNLYDNAYDYQAIIIGSKKANADFYQGIARIMKAHNFHMLVDIYGNVPYSDALKGSRNITPKYDKGIDIYKDLLRQIDTAIALIKGASNSATGPNKTIPDDDIMFGATQFAAGTASVPDQINAMKIRWVQFANTLKLRMLMHLCNGGILSPAATVPGFNIPGEFAIIAAEGSGFMGTGLSAEVNPGYRKDKPSPFFNSYVADAAGTATANSVYYKANSYAVDPNTGAYAYNGDAREGRLYKAGNKGFSGVAYGLPSSTTYAASELAGIGDGLTGGGTGYTADAKVFTTTESLFLQAEAINRGFLPGGDAKSMLAAAITESFVSLGSTSTAASSLIANNAGYPDVDYSASARVYAGFPAGTLPAGGLVTIIEQKWYALNGIAPFEVWTDYRRVDFSSTKNHFRYGISGEHPFEGPTISVYPSNTKTEIPIRLLYPQNEYNYNAVNVGAEGTINAFTSKIFWDVK
jgi:Starch-binding associating with outer membrane